MLSGVIRANGFISLFLNRIFFAVLIRDADDHFAYFGTEDFPMIAKQVIYTQ